jgi:pimeloyl-ACP methyl ester carboxylesterase
MYRFVLAAWLLAAAQAAAAGVTLTPSQFNDGAAVDDAPLGPRLPVVLVHGLGGSGQGWEQWLQVYATQPAWRSAFKPYTFRYDSSTQAALDPTAPRSIRALGAALRDALQASPDFEQGTRSMVIAAHSMGGLVARSMMQEHSFADGRRGGDRVLHLVTLGTPHHGSPLADASIAAGLVYADEFRDAYAGFVANLTWTNHDLLNASGSVCNPWLAGLNSYAPAGGRSFGRCGSTSANGARGYYDRIIAYGVRRLQSRDLQIGTGVFKPGSDPALLVPYAWLREGLSRDYANDGVVPLASAQFDGVTIGARREAVDCDHRYLERGYPVVVRTLTQTTSAWAFCATPSGTVATDIAATATAAANAERVFRWAEVAYAPFLQPAGAVTDWQSGAYVREYAGNNALAMIKDGQVFYRGPSTGGQLVFIAPLAQLLAQAIASGY